MINSDKLSELINENVISSYVKGIYRINFTSYLMFQDNQHVLKHTLLSFIKEEKV